MEKQLPQDIEAEQCVLGSVIIDPEAITLVADFLKPEDFYRNAHKLIYSAMLSLYSRHEPVDYRILCEDLERANQLEQLDGGAAYLTSLINMVPTSGHIEYYGRIVQKKAEHRNLTRVAGMIAQFAMSEDSDALLKAESLIYALSQGKSISRVTSLKDAAARFMTKLDQLHENKLKGVVTGVPTGFKGIDLMLGGFQPSDLIVLAARPAVGKTSWALNVALRIIKDSAHLGHKIMMFSLEMGQEQLMRRLVSMEATVNQTRLRNGDIEDEEWDRIMDAMRTFDTDRMWIDDTPAISLTEMRSRARRIQSEHGLDIIFVDYMQLMRSVQADGKQPENRTQEVSAISRGLKELARELNVPVVALAQLSRAVEQRADKTPQLSDLRESGTIEQDSDVVMFIHQDPNQEMKDNGYALNIMVAKHRNGPVGVDTLWFTPHLTRFSDIEDQFNAEQHS
jgi:replicative DNA helicase